MSTLNAVTRKLPISVSLGLNGIFSQHHEGTQTNSLNRLSSHDKKAFLFEQENFVLVCGNQTKRPKISEPYPTLLSLATQRALALKHHTNKAVYVVVNNRYEGAIIAEQFNAYVSCYKVYTNNPRIRTKIHKDVYADFLNEADFVIITYNNLLKQVTNRNNPLTEQVIFVNPLTRKKIQEMVTGVDAIIGCLHRHKCIKPDFSFFFDEALFPILTKQEYSHLTNAQSVLYYHCSEPPRSAFNNPFKEALPNLSTSQIQFFLLYEHYRGRKTIKKLLKRFQKTLTYKLHLFSNGLFPGEQTLQSDNATTRKKELELRCYAQIVDQLNKWTKRYSKQLLRETQTDMNLESEEISFTEKVTWHEKTVEPERFLPLIEKKKVDNKYYLTVLGESVLDAASCFVNKITNFSAILRYIEKLLYRKTKTTNKLTVREIIRFYLVLLGATEEAVTQCLTQIPEQLDSEEVITKLVEYLKNEFKQQMKGFTGFSAKEMLGAFEQLMDTEAYLVYQQLKKDEEAEEESWEERRKNRILQKANYQPLTVKFTADKYHMLRQPAKGLLEGLVAEGRLIRIQTCDNRGKMKYRYCTQELLDAHPFLQKNCGNCLWYRKRFKTCTYHRLQQALDPSQVKEEHRAYANGKIKATATACGKYTAKKDFEGEGSGAQFTRKIDELTKEMRKIPVAYITGSVTENAYHCFTCQEPIADFGTGSKISFPKKRVSCPNCSTLYLKKNGEKVTIRTEYRHLLRGLYYQATTSLPKILQEKDPSFAFVIHNKESVELELNEVVETSPDLLLCNQRVPLEKLQYLFFAGQRYKELERFLKVLADSDPERYTYTIQRAESKKKDSTQNTFETENASSQPFSSKNYAFLKEFMSYLYKEGLVTQSFLHARTLSNIGAMLAIQETYEQMAYGNWRYDHQLYASVDLLIRVNGGVKTSFYGSQLEGLSNKYFFELLKTEAEQVELWSWGRVNSRLVKDFFLAYSKNSSSAYSPYDALLNQLLRTFRAKIDEIFRKVGLEPTQLGPGLFHRRKTKSDIDQLGFYFDLIEPVRVLVLLTMSNAVREKKLSYSDCSFELGERGQEIYRVKRASQEKISELVSEALAEPVFYLGATIPFTQAFEQNLQSLRVALENCSDHVCEHKQLIKQEILQYFKEAGFSPMIYCPAGMEQRLLAIHKFAGREHELFSGREEEVLKNRVNQESFRKIAMTKWLLHDPISKSKNLRLTHHQQREQDRSIIVLLLMLFYAHQREFSFTWYSTSHLRELLGLTQNQMQRILKQMVAKKFLFEKKTTRKNYYRINAANSSVKLLRLTLRLSLTREERLQRKSVRNGFLLLDRLAKVISNLLLSSDNKFRTCLWNDWLPPSMLQRIATWMSEQITASESYFKSGGEII